METMLLAGDCLARMRELPDASVHAVVTDPPYHLTSIVERFGSADAAPAKSEGPTGVYARASRGFMGQTWDGGDIAFRPELWREVLRVLKPGGYLLAFGGTRTYHRMTVAIEDAGFSIRDCIGWHYGSGFPKSLSVSAAIDKAAGATREVVGTGRGRTGALAQPHGGSVHSDDNYQWPGDYNITAPATADACRWQGWGTALKPAWEPIVVARAPFPGTVAGNVLKHGTGAMNIDGCRVPAAAGDEPLKWEHGRGMGFHGAEDRGPCAAGTSAGRWPANVLLSCPPDCDDDTHAPGCPCAALDAQHDGASRYFNRLPIEADDFVPFFYAAKASRKEREEGCDDVPPRPVPSLEVKVGRESPRAGAGRTAMTLRNHHPTVKPAAVMAWCVRLVTPPGGVVLDPFMGSGSTGIGAVREGVNFIGIEREADYMEIARARIEHAKRSKA